MKIFLTALFLIFAVELGAKQQVQKINNHLLASQITAKFTSLKKILSETKLLKFSLSPSAPKVTEEITAFIQPLTGFTDSEILLEISLDGAPFATVEHPASELWVVDIGKFSESKSHTISAKIYLRDKNSAKLLIDGISALDSDIESLNLQIANATDPDLIAQLTVQRDDKIAQRSELVTTLGNLQSQIGEENYNFSVEENSEAPGYPQVEGIDPDVVFYHTPSSITFFGTNLENTTEVLVDGVAATINAAQPTRIFSVFPGLSLGIHDVEIRAVVNGEVRNKIVKNAIFSVQDMNVPPTAVARVATPEIIFGQPVSVSGEDSYDSSLFLIDYEWRYFSVPHNSSLSAGQIVGTSTNLDFTPDVPGLYVVQLIVFQDDGGRPSSPSYAVIDVPAPTNRAPTVSADPITSVVNQTSTAAITSDDPDWWQEHQIYISRQSSLGTASIDNGVLNFNAGSQAGTDFLTVTIVDNGTPPLVGSVDVSVAVIGNKKQKPYSASVTLIYPEKKEK
jgi:hypothetical protein